MRGSQSPKRDRSPEKSDSDSDSSSSEEERRKKKKKSKKKEKKSKKKKSKKKKKKKKVSSSSSGSDSDSGSASEPELTAEAEAQMQAMQQAEVNEYMNANPVREEGSDEEGPLPAPKVELGSLGGALLPGEGEAIAQYVAEGKRIPRRGEIGLSSDQIESFEDLGYIMSGSRHRRMNAVRVRKENQVYSAEEKRALQLFNYEEKAKRENQILADFKQLLQEKTAEAGLGPGDAGPSDL